MINPEVLEEILNCLENLIDEKIRVAKERGSDWPSDNTFEKREELMQSILKLTNK